MKNRLHVKAPGNWVNDPNGMIYYKGQYHLFYQHFPYAPRWGTMHWGHAVSPDLIHWEHVGVALFPSLYEDQNGCFSGSAVEENGVMHLFYTGVHYNHSPIRKSATIRTRVTRKSGREATHGIWCLEARRRITRARHYSIRVRIFPTGIWPDRRRRNRSSAGCGSARISLT